MTTLEKGTTLTVAAGVVFDLWVSLWLTSRPDTHWTRLITLSIVAVLLTGLLLMYLGWLQGRNNPSTGTA